MFAAHHRLGEPRRDRRPERPAGARLHRATCSTSRRWPTRWRAFGWDVHEVDGHDVAALAATHRRARHRRRAAARARRADRLRQGRLVHGAPDQVALPADVGRRVPAGARGARRERSAREERLRPRRWSSSPTRDPRIVLLTGDLGFMALEPFAERFPDRFFNVGVAEQNMVGVATGPRRGRASSRSSTRSPRSRRCGRTSSSATARCCTTCRCASSASAAASSTARTGVTHHGARGRRRDARAAGHDASSRRPTTQQTRDRAARDLGPARARSTTGSARTTRRSCPGSTAASRSAARELVARRATTSRSSRSGSVAAEAGRGRGAARRATASRARVARRRERPARAGRRPRAPRSARVPVVAHGRGALRGRRPRLARRRGRSPSAASAAALVRCGVRDDARRASRAASAYMHDAPRALGATALVATRARARSGRPRAMTRARSSSIVLPVHNQADHIGAIVRELRGRRSTRCRGALRDRAGAERLPRRSPRGLPRARRASTPSVRVASSSSAAAGAARCSSGSRAGARRPPLLHELGAHRRPRI